MMAFIRLPVDLAITEAACNAWRNVSRHGYIDATDELDLTRVLCLLKLRQ